MEVHWNAKPGRTCSKRLRNEPLGTNAAVGRTRMPNYNCIIDSLTESYTERKIWINPELCISSDTNMRTRMVWIFAGIRLFANGTVNSIPSASYTPYTCVYLPKSFKV
jgi:hypothetical protein